MTQKEEKSKTSFFLNGKCFADVDDDHRHHNHDGSSGKVAQIR